VSCIANGNDVILLGRCERREETIDSASIEVKLEPTNLLEGREDESKHRKSQTHRGIPNDLEVLSDLFSTSPRSGQNTCLSVSIPLFFVVIAAWPHHDFIIYVIYSLSILEVYCVPSPPFCHATPPKQDSISVAYPSQALAPLGHTLL
jgi:hypothetical protein